MKVELEWKKTSSGHDLIEVWLPRYMTTQVRYAEEKEHRETLSPHRIELEFKNGVLQVATPPTLSVKVESHKDQAWTKPPLRVGDAWKRIAASEKHDTIRALADDGTTVIYDQCEDPYHKFRTMSTSAWYATHYKR